MRLAVAAIQMYAVPYAVPHNLRRARALVEAAASQGARLVVLPELFNTGYTYSEAIWDYAEPLDGVTVSWMLDGAQRLGCCIAGALLVRAGSDIFSTMVVAAPGGVLYTYHKRHPFFWERSISREGPPARPAETPLGRMGLLVCADVAYPDSYASYAGQVDLLVASSTAAALAEGTVEYPDGTRVALPRYHPAFAGRAAQMRFDYFQGIGEHAAALGVPAVHAAQWGRFRSPLPAEQLSTLAMLTRCPEQLASRLQHGRPVLTTQFLGHSAIFDACGCAVAVRPAGEGVVVAEVALRCDMQEVVQSALVV